MSASPEFFHPPTAPAFSPCASPPLPHATSSTAAAAEEFYCRTPTPGSGIAFLQAPDTCPPAPRKPRAAPPSACKKRLFHVVTLRLDDLERIFRPTTPYDKRRRSPHNNTTPRPAASATHDELISNPASSSSSSGSTASFNQVLSTNC